MLTGFLLTLQASSLDLTNYAVSPRRAAAARKEMTENETEDEWQRRETDATGASPSRDPTRPPSVSTQHIAKQHSMSCSLRTNAQLQQLQQLWLVGAQLCANGLWHL